MKGRQQVSDAEKLTPYKAVPQGMVPTRWKSVALASGAEVRVGYQDCHPEGGPCIVHDLRTTNAAGERTQLLFGLTVNAARALVLLYVEHGLLGTDEPEAEKPDRSKP